MPKRPPAERPAVKLQQDATPSHCSYVNSHDRLGMMGSRGYDY